jgi:hypothetical protein
VLLSEELERLGFVTGNITISLANSRARTLARSLRSRVDKMKRLTSLLNRSKSSDGQASSNARNSTSLETAPPDSPEANASRDIHSFCEAPSDEYIYLPGIVEACESSPKAAAVAASQIRKFLTREWSSKPHVQYNAIMLIRILSDNPGATFTRNFDKHFTGTVKECLRNCNDSSTQQILRETLDNLEVSKGYDEGLQLLLQMWRKEKGQQASLQHSGSVRRGGPGPYASGAQGRPQEQYEQIYSNGNGRPRQSRQLGGSGGARGQLPPPAELASRVEEAKNTAKILMQLIQSTPAEELLRNELIKEFSERCQIAQKSMQSYINCDSPAPDHDTLQTLIETNEKLSLAGSRYQRAVLAARRAMGGNPSPSPPVEGVQEGGTAFAPGTISSQGMPPPQGYGNSSYFQQSSMPQQRASIPTNGHEAHQAPPGPPPSMLASFQQRDAQQQQQQQPQSYHPSPMSQYSQPAAPHHPNDHSPQSEQGHFQRPSDPFADPVEHEANPAPLAVEPSNYGYAPAPHNNPRSSVISNRSRHQPRVSQAFSIDAEPTYAPSSHQRRDTVDLENAYTGGGGGENQGPASPAISQPSPTLTRITETETAGDMTPPLSHRSQFQQHQPQRQGPGPYHSSAISPSYLGRQASAANGLTMHGAEPDEGGVPEIDSHSDVGRNDPNSATSTQLSGRSGGGSSGSGRRESDGSMYNVSPVEVRTARQGRRVDGPGAAIGGGVGGSEASYRDSTIAQVGRP